MIKQILKNRIVGLMLNYNFNYITSLVDYQYKLKSVFKEDYTLDEIEDCLHVLEENYYDEISRQQVIEYPEDFKLLPINYYEQEKETKSNKSYC